MSVRANKANIEAKKQGFSVHAKKSLGQNFLQDTSICKIMINSLNIDDSDVVIEIGPGRGVLTEALLEKGAKVLSIELDSELLVPLTQKFSEHKNFHLLHENVLESDFDAILAKYGNTKKAKICANIPYYITTDIILKLVDNRSLIDSMALMVQKEAGVRLTSKLGNSETGRISALVEYYFDAKIIADVPKELFLPSPKVDSCVIKLVTRERAKIDLTAKEEKMMFLVIKTAFLKRRKNLINALESHICSKEQAKQILSSLNINSNLRAEDLTMEEFSLIAKALL